MSAVTQVKGLLALLTVTVALPCSVRAQVDQGALAQALRTGDRAKAMDAFFEASQALAPEQMGAELRAALIAALEHQNQAYRASAESAAEREASRSPSPEVTGLAHEFWGEGYGMLIATVIELREPAAVPALAGGLAIFTDRGAVESLADFGEVAAPSLLLVAEGQAWDRWQVEGALATLTRMVENPRGEPLSTATVQRVRELVRKQLTTGVSYPNMVNDFPSQRASALKTATSLAVALRDPELTGLVRKLANDRAAVTRLGVEDPKLVREIQSHASEALAKSGGGTASSRVTDLVI